MEVPEESFHWSSWDSRTCYPRRAFNQGLTDNEETTGPSDNEFVINQEMPRELSFEESLNQWSGIDTLE